MTIARKSFVSLFVLVFALSLFASPRARADVTFGDALLTVGVSTAAGAILGASTLPFYGSPSDNTKNIFYGAAIGAVIGVFIAAYAGVQEGPGYDDAGLRASKPAALSLNDAPDFRLKSEASSATSKAAVFGAGSAVAWSPVATMHF